MRSARRHAPSPEELAGGNGTEVEGAESEGPTLKGPRASPPAAVGTAAAATADGAMASAAAQDGVGDAASHAAERALYRDHCISVALDVSCLLYQAADRAADRTTSRGRPAT